MPTYDESEWLVDVDDVTAGGFHTDLTNEEIKEHIDDAHLEVDEKLLNKGMSDGRLAKIERELARHSIKFAVDEERQVESERIGPQRSTFTGSFDGENLAATTHGQRAIAWDESNTLGPGGGDFWAVTG